MFTPLVYFGFLKPYFMSGNHKANTEPRLSFGDSFHYGPRLNFSGRGRPPHLSSKSNDVEKKDELTPSDANLLRAQSHLEYLSKKGKVAVPITKKLVRNRAIMLEDGRASSPPGYRNETGNRNTAPLKTTTAAEKKEKHVKKTKKQQSKGIDPQQLLAIEAERKLESFRSEDTSQLPISTLVARFNLADKSLKPLIKLELDERYRKAYPPKFLKINLSDSEEEHLYDD